MTNEEALTEARRLEADLASAIAAGEIPPRPDPNVNGDAWRRWYDEHVRCMTQHHQFFQRERGSRFCKQCIAQGVKTLTTYEPVEYRADLRKVVRAWTIDTIASELAKLPADLRERAQRIWRETFPTAAALADAAKNAPRPPARKPRAMP